MPKIIKNGVVYTPDASSLTNGSSTIKNESGHLESSASYVRAIFDSSNNVTIVPGIFRIFAGTDDPSVNLGQNGDIYLKRQQ